MIETVTPVMSVLRSPSQTSGSAATASYHSIEKPPSGSDGKRSSLKEKTKLAAIGAKMKAKASRTYSLSAQSIRGLRLKSPISRAPGRQIGWRRRQSQARRSEEHTSELQSLMRISYAVFCLKKKKTTNTNKEQTHCKMT